MTNFGQFVFATVAAVDVVVVVVSFQTEKFFDPIAIRSAALSCSTTTATTTTTTATCSLDERKEERKREK